MRTQRIVKVYSLPLLKLDLGKGFDCEDYPRCQ